MAEIIVMPKMNLVMEEGLLGRWHRTVGDVVAIGDTLCEVENEKEIADVESTSAGTILRIWGEVGERYSVTTPIALIGEPGEDISEVVSRVEAQLAGTVDAPPPAAEKEAPAEKGAPAPANIKMLPKLRKMIRDMGIDLDALIAYVGKDRITEPDILRFAAAKEAAAAPTAAGGRRERMSGMRRAIASSMSRSCENTARLTNVTEVDMTSCLQRLAACKKEGRKASVTAAVIRACALALREHALLNASVDGDEIVYHDEISIGCAVDVPGGLVVPVVRQADQKDIYTIAREIADFAERGQRAGLTNADMAGGTFTVSNVGMLGVESFTPIINYPQAAIMGVGAVMRLPRYLDSASEIPVPRHIMKLCLTYDHRIVDGAPAARFSLMVRELLENPALLLR